MACEIFRKTPQTKEPQPPSLPQTSAHLQPTPSHCQKLRSGPAAAARPPACRLRCCASATSRRLSRTPRETPPCRRRSCRPTPRRADSWSPAPRPMQRWRRPRHHRHWAHDHRAGHLARCGGSARSPGWCSRDDPERPVRVVQRVHFPVPVGHEILEAMAFDAGHAVCTTTANTTLAMSHPTPGVRQAVPRAGLKVGHLACSGPTPVAGRRPRPRPGCAPQSRTG